MKTLDEIFKDKPELLETPEIKELVIVMHTQYDRLRGNIKALQNKIIDIQQECFLSEAYVINGTSCERTVKNILNNYSI